MAWLMRYSRSKTLIFQKRTQMWTVGRLEEAADCGGFSGRHWPRYQRTRLFRRRQPEEAPTSEVSGPDEQVRWLSEELKNVRERGQPARRFAEIRWDTQVLLQLNLPLVFHYSPPHWHYYYYSIWYISTSDCSRETTGDIWLIIV